MCRGGEGGKECRHKYAERGEMRVPTVESGGVRKVSATCDGYGVSETNGSLVLPETLRLVLREGISARLRI